MINNLNTIDALSMGEEKITKHHNTNESEFKGKLKVTYIENVFGSYLCNYCNHSYFSNKNNHILVKCLNPDCGFESRTFDFFLDLAVNIPEPPKEQSPVYVAKPSSRKKNQRHQKKKKKQQPQKKIKITEEEEEEEVKNENEENTEEKTKENDVPESNLKAEDENHVKKETEQTKAETEVKNKLESETTQKELTENLKNEEKAMHKEAKKQEAANETKNKVQQDTSKPEKEEETKNEQKQEEEEKKEELIIPEENELPFRVIENKKLDVVPYLDKDLYLLYEPNYKKHTCNYKVKIHRI